MFLSSSDKAIRQPQLAFDQQHLGDCKLPQCKYASNAGNVTSMIKILSNNFRSIYNRLRGTVRLNGVTKFNSRSRVRIG